MIKWWTSLGGVWRQCSGFYYHSTEVFPLLLTSLQKQANKTPAGEPVMSLMWGAGKCLVVPNADSSSSLGQINFTAFTHPGGIALLILLWLTSWLLSCPLLNVYLDLWTPEMSSGWGRAVWSQELWGNYFLLHPEEGRAAKGGYWHLSRRWEFFGETGTLKKEEDT